MAEHGGARHVLRLGSVYEPEPGALEGDRVRYDPIGGMQNHLASLSRCLDDLGVEQTVLTSRLGGPTGRSPIGRHGSVRRVGLPMRRLRQLWALCAVPYALRPSRRVDLVHAHQGEDVGTLLLAMLAARVHRAPLVVTLHCCVGHTVAGRSLRAVVLRRVGGAVERAALRRASAVVVLAARTASFVRADGVAPERIRTIPSGFEPRVFAEPFVDPFPEVARPRVGYVGRLAPQKRAELVVEAFGRLRQPAALLVVGDGPDRELVDATVAASPVRDRIVRHGFVEHERVPAVLRSLDVLVLPSAYEELGSVLVEALAVGLPVVATNVGGIPEVVRHEVTGLLVEPGDVQGIAEAVDRVLGDPELAKRLSRNALERAQDYGWPALGRRIADLYDDVLGARVPA